MLKLQKFIPRKVVVHLTDQGFVSTVRYAGLFAKTVEWDTRPSACPETPALVRPLDPKATEIETSEL